MKFRTLVPLFLLAGPSAFAHVTVAIIDTGADLAHPLLKKNLWTNPGESGVDPKGRDRASNGIDDDGNGFIDDVHGWNFTDDSNRVTDVHGHGTHIAGIIATGAPGASLMILKYYDPKASGEENQKNTLRAIEYATKMKVQIINYSAGGTEASAAEKSAIERAADDHILFIAAAGNERSDSDRVGFYPASYELPNILSVTATDARPKMALPATAKILASSNFGRKSVDLAAPGKNILSSVPGAHGRVGLMTGTSQATAFVSAAAARLWDENPGLAHPLELIPYLTQCGDENDDVLAKTKSGHAVNTERALSMKGPELSALGHHLAEAPLTEALLDDESPFRTEAARLSLLP
jgi:subtilisin family serine protease